MEHAGDHGPGLEIDRCDVTQKDGGVLLPSQYGPGGWRDLSLRQDAGRNLVEQRLEQVVRRSGHHGDVYRGAAKCLGGRQATEARSDHHDTVLRRAAILCRAGA
jgi:hypothetical protein